ncbi:MAG: hypothetical protein IT458_07045 [Planctomycetes bacterium]|nr:hypothetical protein [Planctomycetota bacterium]
MNPLASRSLVFAALSAVLAAQDPAGLERFLPRSSYATLRFAGLGACKEAAARFGLHQLVTQTLARGGQPLLDQLAGGEVGAGLARMHDGLGVLALDRAALREVLQGEVAFAVGRPTIAAPEQGMPSLLLVVDGTGRRGALDQVVLAIETWTGLAQGGEPAVEEQEGVKVQVHSFGRRATLVKAMAGDVLLVSNSPGMVREALSAARSGRGTIAEEPGYRRARARAGGTPLLHAYANLGVMSRIFEPFLPYEASDLGRALGLQGVRGLSVVAGIGDGTGAEVWSLECDFAQQGILPEMAASQVSGAAARWMPEDAVAVASVRCDGAAIVQGIERIAAALPVPFREESKRGLAAPVDGTGATVRELAGLLGPEITVGATVPLQRTPLPQVVLAFAVRDPQRVVTLLNQLIEARSRRPIRHTTFQGVEIHYLEAGSDQVRVAPAYAVVDGHIVATLQVPNLKAVLARSQKSGEAPKAVPALASLRVDLGAAAAPFWPLVTQQALPQLAAQGYGALADALPGVDEVRAKAGVAEWTLAVDQGGMVLRRKDPLTMGAWLASLGTAVDWALSPAPFGKKVY